MSQDKEKWWQFVFRDRSNWSGKCVCVDAGFQWSTLNCEVTFRWNHFQVFDPLLPPDCGDGPRIKIFNKFAKGDFWKEFRQSIANSSEFQFFNGKYQSQFQLLKGMHKKIGDSFPTSVSQLSFVAQFSTSISQLSFSQLRFLPQFSNPVS